ncbi:MAG: prepilin peptidase [Blastocatellia bacterium]
MGDAVAVAGVAVLIPLNPLIAYYDMRYRRIPNMLAAGTLVSGISINMMCRGGEGLIDSLFGFMLAFSVMLGVRFLTGLGAGDVKLFGAIGALMGARHVLPAFLLVLLLGGGLAAVAMLRAGLARHTMLGVYRIFAGMLPGGQLPPREDFARSGLTIPYGVAIAGGSLLRMLGTLMWG